jgi:hypothetical protein
LTRKRGCQTFPRAKLFPFSLKFDYSRFV